MFSGSITKSIWKMQHASDIAEAINWIRMNKLNTWDVNSNNLKKWPKELVSNVPKKKRIAIYQNTFWHRNEIELLDIIDVSIQCIEQKVSCFWFHSCHRWDPKIFPNELYVGSISYWRMKKANLKSGKTSLDWREQNMHQKPIHKNCVFYPTVGWKKTITELMLRDLLWNEREYRHLCTNWRYKCSTTISSYLWIEWKILTISINTCNKGAAIT